MSAPRNFRKILDVDPDSPRFHCVGETRGGGRCGQFMFSASDLSQASAILTKMDSQTLKSSYRYLEELAFLTLCARWHRRPERSQIGLVTWRWRQKIQQLEKEEAEMALNLMTRRRPVAWKAVAVEEVMAAVKEERTEKIPATTQPSGNRSSVKMNTAYLVDPFVSKNSSVHATASETPFTQLLKAWRATTSETSSHNTSSYRPASTRPAEDPRNDSPTLPALVFNLPSPPDTPLVLRQRDPQDAREEDERQLVLVGEFEVDTNRPPVPPKSFDFGRQPCGGAPIEKQQLLSFSPADLKFLRTTMPNYWPDTPQSVPKSRLQRREGINFGPEHGVAPKALESSLRSASIAISGPEKASTMFRNINNGPDPESKKGDPERADNEAENMQAAGSGKSDEEQKEYMNSKLAPLTSHDKTILPNPAKSLPGDELPHTPDQAPEVENFGYAIITSTIRSRSYRPAIRRYRLITPPDEPEVSPRKTFMIPRKPVNSGVNFPTNQPRVQNALTESEGRKEAINARRETQSSDGEEASTSCLQRLGIGRMREALVEKVRYIRRRRQWAGVKVRIWNRQ